MPSKKPRKRPPARNPGELQLAILKQLWEEGEASVARVHEALLPSRGLALTTIATMLRKMEKRGLVCHRSEGRQFIYRAAVDEGGVHRSMVGEVVDRLFAGSASEMVSHLLDEGAFDPAELAELRARIAAKEAELREGDDAAPGGRCGT